MGMFDWVKYEAPCPNCGAPVTRFQSKDGACQLHRVNIAALAIASGTNRVSLYSSCDQCHCWVEMYVGLAGATLAPPVTEANPADRDL